MTRHFSMGRRVFLGDVSIAGRLRLDAIACYLQDVATNDAEDAKFEHDRGWVLRRMDMDIVRLPTVYEDVSLTTWCSGIGSRWAERSTTLTDTREVFGGVWAQVQAVWVHISFDTGASQPVPPEFYAVYGEGVLDKKVSARLRHPAPPEGAPRKPWPLRLTDFDVFGHVNNAVYWSPVEDEIVPWLGTWPIGRCEIEFRAGIDPGDEPELIIERADALTVWFMVGDDVRASVRVHPR